LKYELIKIPAGTRGTVFDAYGSHYIFFKDEIYGLDSSAEKCFNGTNYELEVLVGGELVFFSENDVIRA